MIIKGNVLKQQCILLLGYIITFTWNGIVLPVAGRYMMNVQIKIPQSAFDFLKKLQKQCLNKLYVFIKYRNNNYFLLLNGNRSYI